LGKDFLAERRKPCRDYRFESQKQNSNHQGKQFFPPQELHHLILSRHASESIEYAYPFDHFNPFLKGGISSVAFYIILEKIFTAPSTLQYCPNIKKDILW